MKIGLVARADATGLGVQTKEFFDNMQPHKTMIVDLTKCSGKPMDISQFPGATVLEHVPYPETNSLGRTVDKASKDVIDDFLEDLDIVFTCETPYDYWLFRGAQARGVKSVLQFNYELLDYMLDLNLPKPDLMMAPSRWHYQDVADRTPDIVFLPAPVNRQRFPQRSYDSPVINTWFHPGGNPVMEDRNGTQSTLDAWKSIRGNTKLIVTTPNGRGLGNGTNKAEIRVGLVKDNADLYPGNAEGFIFPRKFGGLCLPLNEAASLGLPILMTDLSPQNEFLLPEGLVDAPKSHEVMTKCMIDIHQPDQSQIIEVVDRLSKDEELVDRMRIRSQEIAEKISWKALKPLYLDTFSDLIEGHIEQKFEWGF